MKSITLRSLFLTALVALTAIFSCDPKDAPTEEERVTELLSQGTTSWSLPASGGVIVGTEDVTADLFAGFTLKFNSNGTLVTTGTTPVWLRNDTWHFKDATAKVIIRGQDNIEIQIEEVSATELQLSLNWPHTTTTTDGRSKSIAGVHKFVLQK